MFRLALLALVFIGVYAFAEPKFPDLTGRVVDEAGLLSKAQEQSLADMSGTIERDSTVQVVVVTLKSLDGYDIAEYGYQLARYWKVGQRDEDNGILIMIAPKDRKVRIEIGYGLEAFITDAEAYEMIQSKMLPRFKEKDVYGGIRDTIDAIGTIVSKEYQHDYGAYKTKQMDLFYIVSIALIPLLFVGVFTTIHFFKNTMTVIVDVIGAGIIGAFIGVIVWIFSHEMMISLLIGGIVTVLLFFAERFTNFVSKVTNKVITSGVIGIFTGLLIWIFSHIIIISAIVGIIIAIIAYFSDRYFDYGSMITNMGDASRYLGRSDSSGTFSGDSFEIFSGGGGDFGGAGASADIGSVLDGLGSL